MYESWISAWRYDFGVVSGLIQKKVMAGTKNLLVEPAMSRKQAMEALEVGIDLATEAAREGIGLIGTGDMGIGNTTPSAAITAVMTDHPVAEVTGRGTGIDEAAHAHKVTIIQQAIDRHRPNRADALDVLAKVGGLEIGGLAGHARRRCRTRAGGFGRIHCRGRRIDRRWIAATLSGLFDCVTSLGGAGSPSYLGSSGAETPFRSRSPAWGRDGRLSGHQYRAGVDQDSQRDGDLR